MKTNRGCVNVIEANEVFGTGERCERQREGEIRRTTAKRGSLASLVHLDTLDSHPALLHIGRPGGTPFTLGLGKLVHGGTGTIDPRLSANAVWVPPICTASRN